MIEPLGRHREADQTTAVLRHEVDGFGGDLFRCYGQITLVLSIFVVSDDHHLARAYRCDGILDLRELVRAVVICCESFATLKHMHTLPALFNLTCFQ